MSLVAAFHQAHKARQQRIAARAVPQAESGSGSMSRSWPVIRRLDRDYERAWAFEILGLRESADRPPSKLRIEDIQRATARHFGIEHHDMLSTRRGGVVGRARQVAMYLAKGMTAKSYPEIGRRFGGRDHSTVMHAVNRIEVLLARDGELADTVGAIRAAVDSGQE